MLSLCSVTLHYNALLVSSWTRYRPSLFSVKGTKAHTVRQSVVCCAESPFQTGAQLADVVIGQDPCAPFNAAVVLLSSLPSADDVLDKYAALALHSENDQPSHHPSFYRCAYVAD